MEASDARHADPGVPGVRHAGASLLWPLLLQLGGEGLLLLLQLENMLPHPRNPSPRDLGQCNGTWQNSLNADFLVELGFQERNYCCQFFFVMVEIF